MLRQPHRVAQSSDGQLQTLWRGARHRERLTRSVRALLPEDLAGHCIVGGARGNTLLLLVPNPSWAARLRYEVDALRLGLNQLADFASVEKIKVRVADFDGAVGSSQQQSQRARGGPIDRPRSREAAKSLSAAATLTDYAPLSAALRALARHHTPAAGDTEPQQDR